MDGVDRAELFDGLRTVAERCFTHGDEAFELTPELLTDEERGQLGELTPQRLAVGWVRLGCRAVHGIAQNDDSLDTEARGALFAEVRRRALQNHARDQRKSADDAKILAWVLSDEANALENAGRPDAALALLARELPVLDEVHLDSLALHLGMATAELAATQPLPTPRAGDARGPRRWDIAPRVVRAGILARSGRYEEALRTTRELSREIEREHAWQVTVPSLRQDAQRLAVAQVWCLRFRAEAYAAMGLLDQAAAETRAMNDAALDFRAEAGDRLQAEHERDLSATLLHGAQMLADYGRFQDVVDQVDQLLASSLRLEMYTREAVLLRDSARLELARQASPERRSTDLAALRAEWAARPEPTDPLGLRRSCELQALAALALEDMDSARAWAARVRGCGSEDRLDALTLASLEARICLADPALGADEQRPALARLSTEMHGWMQGWSTAPLRPGGVGFLLHGTTRDMLATLARLHVACDPEDGPAAALDALLAAQAQGTLSRALHATATTVADLAPLVRDGSGLAVFLPAPDGSVLWLVDEAGVTLHTLEGDGALAEPLRRHARACLAALASGGDADLARERELAREVAPRVWPADAAQRVAGWSAVTLVGADLFGRTALEMLPGPWGEFLCADRAVDFTPSLPLTLALLRRRAERAPAAGGLLCAASPTLAADVEQRWSRAFPPLALRDGALTELASAYVGPGRVLTGDEVTVSALRAATPAGFAVAQYLTHGVQLPDRERSAALLLAPDGSGELLDCDAVDGGTDGAPLGAARFTLVTSCRAGTGPERRGDACSSDLGGAHLRAGSDAVLTSTSDLEFGTTLALSEELHRRLAGGTSPAEALRAAREALARRGVPPPLTGALRVYGLGQLPVLRGDAVRPLASTDGGASPSVPTPGVLALGALLASAVLVGATWTARRRRG